MLIELKNLYRTYDNKASQSKVEALKDISLAIKKGEFVSIIGASGSGKSTLMNILGMLDMPDSGSYFFGGRDVTELSDKEISRIRNRNIGFIFQSFNLIPSLTTLENVTLPLQYRGMAKRERIERAKKALNSVGLSARYHHKPTELSGGQQQRVAIARAIASDPELILADEPCGNLDSKASKEIMNMLRDLNKQNCTVVLITHDNEAAKYADRILTVSDGMIAN